MKLFSMDGKLLENFNKITDLITLNLLWLICCLPVITAGASTSALYQVTLQIAENRESYIAKTFFHAFRENFKQATLVWLICLIAGFLLVSDFFIVSHFFAGSSMPFLIMLLFMLTLLLFAGFLYFFPVIAYFKNSLKKIFSNSFRLAFGYLGTTLQLFLLSLLPLIVLFVLRNHIILGSFLFVIILPALTSFCQSVLLAKLFHKIK